MTGAWSHPRVAVVTGGASGIGRAISRRLAADGAFVAVLDLDGDVAAKACAKIVADGGAAMAVTVDVADWDSVETAVLQVNERFGAPTILVNSAGLEGFESFLDITPERWDRILRVNLTGTFYCCRAVVPYMLEEGWGRIVNISSSSAQKGNPKMTHYSAAKAGLVGFTKALALELGPNAITVNTIPPSFVDTPMLRRSEARGLLGMSVEEHEKLTPVRRVGSPSDVAGACAFLVRDEAGFVTGQVIGVNGGRIT